MARTGASASKRRKHAFGMLYFKDDIVDVFRIEDVGGPYFNLERVKNRTRRYVWS